MAGDAQTGVAVMQMEEGLDTGPICMMEETAVGADETTGALHGRLARLGADLVGRALAALERGTLACRAQPSEGVTYAKKIDKAEARIDWARSAGEVHAQIRGLSPVPGAWFEAVIGGRSERIKVLGVSLAEGGGAAGAVLDNRLTVACGCGSVRLTMLQRAGGKPMAAEDFQRGADIRAGHSLIVSG
jgi:methionyl-tRNA formyltransferase